MEDALRLTDRCTIVLGTPQEGEAVFLNEADPFGREVALAPLLCSPLVVLMSVLGMRLVARIRDCRPQP